MHPDFPEINGIWLYLSEGKLWKANYCCHVSLSEIICLVRLVIPNDCLIWGFLKFYHHFILQLPTVDWATYRLSKTKSRIYLLMWFLSEIKPSWKYWHLHKLWLSFIFEFNTLLNWINWHIIWYHRQSFQWPLLVFTTFSYTIKFQSRTFWHWWIISKEGFTARAWGNGIIIIFVRLDEYYYGEQLNYDFTTK